jgi:hypothetical protein
MTIKKILSKIFFCDEDSVNNVLMHIPVGNVNVGIALYNPYLGLLFGVGFIIYELNEQLTYGDKAFQDIKGWLWGIGILSIILLIRVLIWN